jgi:DNA-binding transcriptional ArsR family regulator
MPLSAEIENRPQAITVSPASVVEIYGFMSTARRDGGSPLAGEELLSRIRGFWTDLDDQSGTECTPAFDELLVYAATDGALTAESPAPFLSRLRDLTTRDVGPLLLRTERADVRAIVERHLAILRRDARRRAQYVALIEDVWAAIRERWETVGLQRVRARAAQLQALIDRGVPFPSLLPPKHIALRPYFRPLLEEAVREGRLTVAVGFFGSGQLIYDLPGTLLLGIRISAADPAEEARRRTKGLSERFRALGDPTRLAMAAYLAEQAATVSELADAFDLAQPTVSAHVRGLREAELVESERVDGRTRYRIAEADLDGLFDAAKKRLFFAD